MSGKNDLQRLYDDHVAIAECISKNDLKTLQDRISHHIYDGFNASALEVRKHPEYFKIAEKES